MNPTETSQDAAFLKTHHLLWQVVDHIREGVVILDNGRISYSNRRFAEIVGQPLEALPGSRLSDYLVVPDRAKLHDFLRQAKEGEISGELTLQTDGGRRILIQLCLRTAASGGHLTTAIIAVPSHTVPINGEANGSPVGNTPFIPDGEAEAEIRRYIEHLRTSNEELALFNASMVDREIRMVELKKEVNELCQRLGEPRRYPYALMREEKP